MLRERRGTLQITKNIKNHWDILNNEVFLSKIWASLASFMSPHPLFCDVLSRSLYDIYSYTHTHIYIYLHIIYVCLCDLKAFRCRETPTGSDRQRALSQVHRSLLRAPHAARRPARRSLGWPGGAARRPHRPGAEGAWAGVHPR